jgi:hypothetical protein
MAMAEQHRPPAAHEVDIFASVDIANAASVGGCKKLRVTFRKPRRVQVTPHPAGNDPMRARPQARIRHLRFVRQRRLSVHGFPQRVLTPAIVQGLAI